MKRGYSDRFDFDSSQSRNGNDPAEAAEYTRTSGTAPALSALEEERERKERVSGGLTRLVEGPLHGAAEGCSPLLRFVALTSRSTDIGGSDRGVNATHGTPPYQRVTSRDKSRALS